MLRPFALSFLLLLVVSRGLWPAGAAEPDLRPELEPQGSIESLTVTPSGDLWFGTRLGYAYVSRDRNRTWNEVDVSVNEGTEENFYLGDHLSLVRFFDRRRGFFAGYQGREKNLVYRTIDGGATWSYVVLPISGFWAYDAQATAEGLAWLVGSTGDVLFSEDFGETWRVLSRPFETSSMRTHAVHFADPSTGVVGALSDALALTRDGGAGWRSLPPPVSKEPGDERCAPDGRIEAVRLQEERLLVTQCGATYVGSPSAEPGWREVEVGGRAVVTFAAREKGIVAVTDDLEVVFLNETLDEPTPTGLRLRTFPRSVAVQGETVAVLESDGNLSVWDGTTFRTSRMFAPGDATSWPIREIDRGDDEALWGISSHFLYRSENGGTTWDRRAELPTASQGLAVQASGDVLIWDGHGAVFRWEPAEETLSPVPVLDGLDLVGLFRRGDLWLAWGGMQYETTRRIEVARSYFGGQFAGSVPYGFLAASTDGGATWKVIDRWEDGGVQRVFLSDDDRLYSISYLGAIRRGDLRRDAEDGVSLEMATVLEATEETRDAVPYVESVFYFEFLRGETGWVHGWTHHLGTFLFRSRDGGASWEDASCGPCYEQLRRLGDGRWIAVSYPKGLLAWDGRRFEPFEAFGAEIEWTRVDATGALLVGLENGEILALDRDGETWRTVRPARDASSGPSPAPPPEELRSRSGLEAVW